MKSTEYKVITNPNELSRYFEEYKQEVDFLNDSLEHKQYLLDTEECFKEWLEDTYELTTEED